MTIRREGRAAEKLDENELDVDPKVILGSPVKGFAEMRTSYNDALHLLKNVDKMYKMDIIQPYGTEQRLSVFKIFTNLIKR